MYTITIRQPNGTAVHAALTPGRPCVVGRQTANLGELLVDDAAVSGRHLQITEESGDLWIEDLGSVNGTYLEEERQAPEGQTIPRLAGRLAPRKRARLRPGQPVSFGASLLQVKRVTDEGGWDKTNLGGLTWNPKYIAVLYADMVDSTKQAFQFGPRHLITMQAWYGQLFRERFKRFSGKETKFTGDGFEAVFGTVSDALLCAASCQRALARRNHEHPAEPPVYVRMGVNAGEGPSGRGKKVEYGAPLDVAKRVMSRAEGEQVLVPAHVVGMLVGSRLPFAPTRKQLTGLDAAIDLYEFLWRLDLAADDEQPGSQRRGAGVSAKSATVEETLS